MRCGRQPSPADTQRLVALHVVNYGSKLTEYMFDLKQRFSTWGHDPSRGREHPQAGLRTVTWTLDKQYKNNNCLIFFTLHCARVFTILRPFLS